MLSIASRHLDERRLVDVWRRRAAYTLKIVELLTRLHKQRLEELDGRRAARRRLPLRDALEIGAHRREQLADSRLLNIAIVRRPSRRQIGEQRARRRLLTLKRMFAAARRRNTSRAP